MTKEIQKWKVIRSEYAIQEGDWLNIRRDCVELPNGNRINSYYTMEYPNWVNMIAITDEGYFIFVRQYRHGIKEVNYELCAGVCDTEDASPMVSAQRELMEETGYGGGDWQLYMVSSANPGTHTNRNYSFLVKGVVKMAEQNLEDTEDISVHLFTLDEVKELLKNGDIKQSMMAAPLWKYIAENDLW